MSGLLDRVDALETDRDIYSGLSCTGLSLQPDNIVAFSRAQLRHQDYAGTVHHRYVLIFFLSQPGTVFIQRHRYAAKEGQVVLVRPFEQHYYALSPGPLRWLFITFELPSRQSFVLVPPCITPAPLSQWILDQFLHAYCAREQTACGLWLALLLHQLPHEDAVPETMQPATPEQAVAERVNRYIHDHVAEQFGLQDVARHCGRSVSHLRLMFRRTMGISLGRYIQRIRLDRAHTLLQTTQLTVGEVAYACGFASPSAFCRAFRHLTGCSPKAYRASYKP